MTEHQIFPVCCLCQGELRKHSLVELRICNGKREEQEQARTRELEEQAERQKLEARLMAR